MLKLEVKNFRILRSLVIDDPSSFSVIIGSNEAGKSSIASAIKLACTGEAYNKRGRELATLCTHGETSFSINFQVGQFSAKRTTASGDAIQAIADKLAVPKDCLPLLFDAEVAGDGGGKAMKTFLSASAEAKFDPAPVFADDPDIRYKIHQARQANKLTTKHIVEFCTAERAKCVSPIEPQQPAFPQPTEAEKESARATLLLRQAEAGQAKAKYDGFVVMAAQIAATAQYVTELENFTALSKLAAAGDPLPDRKELTALAGINWTSAVEISDILFSAGEDDAGQLMVMAVSAGNDASTRAKDRLAATPAPIQAPYVPSLRPDCANLYKQANTIEALNALAAECLTAQAEAKAAMDIAKHTQTLAAALVQTLTERDGAWKSYNEAAPVYNTRLIEARDAWHSWDKAAKSIAAAEEEFNKTQGDAFGKLVSEIAAGILQGRTLRINPTDGIFLGVEPIGEISKSTRWRVELAVMAAAAITLKSPILIIDGADILDYNNRGIVIPFLLEYVVPRFKHVILTASSQRPIAEEQPLGNVNACKWLLDKGAITRLG